MTNVPKIRTENFYNKETRGDWGEGFPGIKCTDCREVRNVEVRTGVDQSFKVLVHAVEERWLQLERNMV